MADKSLSRVCSFEGCQCPAVARGWCHKHYKRWQVHGDPGIVKVKGEVERKCSIDGCDKRHQALGFCNMHYYRFREHGDPLKGKTFCGAPMRWIMEHASYDGDDCIKWPFEVAASGYGSVLFHRKKRVASRVMCEIAHGSPPEKSMEAAHSCGNGARACMNPNHLSWKTSQENSRDAIRHGTWMHGERVPFATLTRDQVREIRRLKGKMKLDDIGELFGVTKSAVSAIFCGKSWAWLE